MSNSHVHPAFQWIDNIMPPTDREPPYSVSRGERITDRWLLTHVEWHPSNWFGDFGQPETGVRERQPDGTWGNFQLIQHGWWDFAAAEALILRALDKGWDAGRIYELMRWMHERRPNVRGTVL